MGNIPDTNPATQLYNELDQAYRYFNDKLWDGRLPPCVVILDRAPRRLGHFLQDGYATKPADGLEDEVKVDEIGMNPEAMRVRSDAETLSTLVHEQAHNWQRHFGSKMPKRAYHNKEWANKMEEVGLMPSSTAQPGGKRTGRLVSHYIVEGGPFAKACEELIRSGFRLSYAAIPMVRVKSESGKRVKYQCPDCEQIAYAKEDARIRCSSEECDPDDEGCGQLMTEA